MAKVIYIDQDIIGFMCPGCGERHTITINGRKWPSTGATWNFDGNMDSPTITPSVNISWGAQADANFEPPEGAAPEDWSGRCHSEITAGEITFAGDSTHGLRGQKVPLPDL